MMLFLSNFDYEGEPTLNPTLPIKTLDNLITNLRPLHNLIYKKN